MVCFIHPKIRNGSGSDEGCDFDRFEWCEGLTTTSLWIFYGFYILIFGLSFSFLNIAMTTLYSKIIGPRKQVHFFRITTKNFRVLFRGFSKCREVLEGCSLRSQWGFAFNTVLKTFFSYVYTLFGPRTVWSLEIVLITVVIFTWYIFYGRMVPYNEWVEKKTKKLETKNVSDS